MTIVRHELRRGKRSFLIWTGAISFLLAVCIFLYPEMKEQMAQLNDTFSSMGSFTAAFGMDRLNFGTLLGYYAIECGNVLGLGGALFVSLYAAGMLCKEEKGHTAEFLLAHPIRRERVVLEKGIALLVQVLALNLIVCAVSVGAIAAVGEPIPWKEFGLLHLAYLLMQLELAGICFGLSAFLRRGGAGIGLGIALLMYVLHLIANLTESAKALDHITPFAYCDGAEIVSSGSLDAGKIAVGLGVGALCVLAAFWQYRRKDITC